MSDIEKINMIVAIYGAIAATTSLVIAVILGVIEYRRNQPLIKIRLDTREYWNPNPHARNNSRGKFLSINVSNRGTRPVTINSFGFLDKQRHILVFPDLVEPPFKLEDGESHDILIPVHTLAADEKFLENLWRVRVSDGTGKTWETNFSNSYKRWILKNGKI